MKIEQMSDDDVLQEIESIGVAQFKLLDQYQVTKYNILFDRLMVLVDELKARPGDQRILLLQHYDHPNLQVRLNAAVHTLAVAPIPAREQLEAIKARQRFPQAASAASCLMRLADGTFKPTQESWGWGPPAAPPLAAGLGTAWCGPLAGRRVRRSAWSMGWRRPSPTLALVPFWLHDTRRAARRRAPA